MNIVSNNQGTQKNVYFQSLRLYMNYALRNRFYTILYFPKDKKTRFEIDDHMRIIVQNPAVFAVESTYFDETFSNIKLKNFELLKNERECPLENENDKGRIYPMLTYHISFVEYFENYRDSIIEYFIILRIHFDSIELLKYFLDSKRIVSCALPQQNVPAPDKSFYRIDSVNIMLKKQQDLSIEKQAEEILKYQKYLRESNFIITFANDIDGDMEKFNQQTKDFQKVNKYARHFILDAAQT